MIVRMLISIPILIVRNMFIAIIIRLISPETSEELISLFDVSGVIVTPLIIRRQAECQAVSI